jgi:REP element-mobilizing transposase RayT
MPRRNIQFIQGSYYHIYNRGAIRQSIFREDRNYAYLLRLMKQVAAECKVAIIAYCLLPNHYHWLVRQDGDTSAGVLPKRVFGSYSQAFNRAYNGSGTLFQGPYCATLVDSDAYLLHICRYIHGNAVKHGIAATPEAWPYSNYHEWIGLRSGTLVDLQFISDNFGTPQQYQAFVHEYLANRAELADDLQRLDNELEAI